VRLLVQHRSTYRYPEPAQLGTHTLRLHPAAHTKASIETYRLSCEQAERIRWTLDPYGNRVAQLSFAWPERLRELEILVEMAVEIRPVNPFDFFVDHRCSELGFAYPDEYRSELEPFLRVEDPVFETGARFEALLAELPSSGDIVQGLVELNRRTHAAVAYVIREEAGVWTPEQTLEHGRGSCRDSAVLLVALLRRRGIAARFVSGYLIQVTDEGMLPDLPKGLDHDVADLHAWAEAYVPGGGWIGLDATSGLLAGEGHIPLASASTPALAAPLFGSADVLAETVEFTLSVARLGHEPRPTAPYTDEVWSALREAGRRCDSRLEQLGLRMTMGGEPTFNAREDIDAPEWNTAALGPSKWRHGLRLIAELREHLAPNGLVLQRMGKHYPGESLPRWALDAIARTDGERLWGEGGDASDAVPEPGDAKQLAGMLADALGLAHGLIAAYEDPWHFIDREARVPVDLDPLRFDLDDGEERARLARVLSRGLREPAGYVLPLVREPDGAWRTQAWSFRREHLFLLPGDSPIGLRLPLDSLAGEADVIAVEEPTYPGRQDPRLGDPPEVDQAKLELAAAAKPKPSAVHTALCVELREQSLHVFLPPLARERDFIDLVAVIDRVRRGRAITLEGYSPPSGPLLERISVTPDPGVLEVNLPPRADTQAHIELLGSIYDAALRAGLHSEKYLLDGRLAGSGGGHHLTLGGPTPLESPFIQHPDLLASLITFIQHHPSLSYMFTGLFVGPTSQAPRVDEARPEQLDELELALAHAFAQRGQEQPPPWLSDLLFRNLLVDLTGNTHRTELSIDKLFDHRTPSGRSGLVEFRAFEMPPHPRMAAAQMLLVRSLVTAFAEQPYPGQLVRWGRTLHDRFLLPYWMWRDFEDVLAFLAARGLPLDADGYRPFVDLRCPLVGHLQASDVRVELRNAIEPWNVLGEEQSATGTARYVDSSLERIEIRVEGLIPERHAILVNGHALPLRPTERDGLFVGGVRFRAWAPPHSLHGHIGIHHPLHVDVLDRWAKRSLGACTYHVWHPEGRGFVAPPLTRFEAAARRQQRFTRGDQSPFPISWSQAEPPGEVPYTMDLRRCDPGKPMPEPLGEEPDPEPRIERELVIDWLDDKPRP
jgi:uncharacterized protein (DUF2126 family)/transglutaminase-like putative cysteine protease